MYLALYRKWRPQKFSDVCGQDFITDILRREVATQTVSHAYLFCGLRGTGKTTCAKILAKAVNCLSPKDGEPCGECENCKEAERGALLDIAEIDAASNNGVDSIRSMIDEIAFLPSVGKRKVYIIDEVHMLSAGAFNALLKTLEEPPEHVIFILCTTETHKIPATILSRCQRFDFGRIGRDDIVARLKYIAEKEGVKLDDAAALLIARLSDGALRDALSLFELCAGGGAEVTHELAANLLGVPDREKFHSLCKAFAARDTAAALCITDGMLAGGKASAVCSELIEFFRDLLVCVTVPDPSVLITELPDELEKTKATAALFTRSELLYTTEVLEKCLATLPLPNVNAKTTLEMAAIKLSNIEKTTDVSALFARVEALERGVPRAVPEKAYSKAVPEPEKAPEAPKPAEKAAETKKAPEAPVAFDRWEEFVDAVALEDRVARSFVALGKGFIRNDTLEILLPDAMSVSMLKMPAREEALKRAAKSVRGVPTDVAVTLKKTENKADFLLDGEDI